MARMNNNKGYALVLTLLILVVFMALALYLMGRSYSSTKQNEVVEENYQSAALAEMGVTQYKIVIKDAYEKSKRPIEKKLASDPDFDSTNRGIINELECELKKQLRTMVCGGEVEAYSITVDEKGPSSFTIKNFVFDQQEEGKLKVTFTSTDNQEGEVTSLNVTMIIPIDAQGGFGEGGQPVGFDVIKLPSDINPDCVDPKNKDVHCDRVVMKDDSEYPGNNKSIEKELIYAQNDLELSGNANNFEYAKIHVEKDFTLMKNMNNAKKVYIEVKENAYFKGHLDTSLSDIYVQQDMFVEKQLKLYDHSTLYVGGSLTVDSEGNESSKNGKGNGGNDNNGNGNKLDVSLDSTMCIGGSLHGYPTADIDGKIYMKGSKENGRIELDSKSSGLENIEFLDEETFNNKCGHKNIWGEIETQVEYEYN
ncbi:hypothetical protein [Bacillus sp. Marseille-Q1617]|uniref:hypothetical protein n=1 Tax=Bacillus sp. Marseille-Q1617 TaxID=2736887 RepID=UPI00158B2A72|nr:hypothetical protein [Bacillus sp. Marseille-Q1617]